MAEVYANLTRGGDRRIQTEGGGAASGFLQYASARRLERLQAERAIVDMVLRGPVGPDAGAGLGGSLFSTEMLRVLSEARDRRGP